MTEECIHCGACTRHCAFLDKYQMDIGDETQVEKLAYHCFLCGKCESVCPVGINGKERFLEKRREKTRNNNGKITEDGYEMLIKEKQNYLFRNYRNVTSGRVLFPGCNFPSFYPQTTKKLAALLKKEAGIGTVYDCCGKPIAELGLEDQEKKIIQRINQGFRDAGVTEVIMICPNCYYFLKDRIDIKVTGIYELLGELGIGKKIKTKEIHLFTPCPDKEIRLWQKHMKPYLPEKVHVIMDIQCCGLGGCARAKEPEISRGFTDSLKQAGYDSIYTYCGSCAGKFVRDQMKGVHHILADILETGEEPDVAKSMVNRAMSRFW